MSGWRHAEGSGEMSIDVEHRGEYQEMDNDLLDRLLLIREISSGAITRVCPWTAICQHEARRCPPARVPSIASHSITYYTETA